MVGNPSVYPPLFILLTVPLALISATAAAWIWLAILAASVVVALRVLDVRDWRCYLIALTSPVVVQGLGWGNLTLFLVLPLALTWRYRDRAFISGVSLGLALAAKLFVFPVVAWLLITRRFKAAGVALASATAMLLGPWMLIGFEGFVDYPALLSAVKDVYAARSASFTGALDSAGLDGSIATAIASIALLLAIAAAAIVANRPDGDRKAFAIVVAACVLASPIVWPNYFALMFVPIAVTWPRLAPAWFFAYACWLVEFLPKRERAPIPCCRPDDVPSIVWTMSHSIPAPWYAFGMTAVLAAVAVWCVVARPSGADPLPARDTT
jgi:hypothetical protein